MEIYKKPQVKRAGHLLLLAIGLLFVTGVYFGFNPGIFFTKWDVVGENLLGTVLGESDTPTPGLVAQGAKRDVFGTQGSGLPDSPDSPLISTGVVKAVEDEISENSLVFRLKVYILEAVHGISAKFDTDLEVGNDVSVGNNVDIGGSLSVGDIVITPEGIESPNLVYSILAGTGITVAGTQDITITNSDLGSSQLIFKNFKIGSNTISAGNNNDTLTWEGSNGISLANDGKTITISASGSELNVSGWTDDGSTIRLTTSTDNVGIGTTTATEKLTVSGNGTFSGNLEVGGNLEVLGTTTVLSGFNNSGGGITNAGAITGATGFTSSGTITFSAFGTGIVHSNASGVLSSSAVNLATGGANGFLTGALSAANGGTGIASYNVGDLIYASGGTALSALGIGGDGQILTVSGGAPVWGASGAGDPCPTCIVNNPGTTQTITPSSATATGLVLKQANAGSVDAFRVENFDGTNVYFKIDSSGNVTLGNQTSSGVFTVSPTNTDPISISPVAQGAGQFTGTITSEDLTANRTWTFPDATGLVCLTTGNCAGVGGQIGGSGTTNFLAKFQDSSNIENSLLFDNGTNVGVGTTVPTGKFSVVSSGNQYGATIHSTHYGLLISTDDNSATRRLLSLQNLAGGTPGGGTDVFVVLANGNVGIGTNTPSSALQVIGATTLSNTLNVTGATTLSSTLDVTGGITSGGNLSVNGIGNSYVMGNFGIGTSAPARALDVNGDAIIGGAELYLSGTAGSTSGIRLQRASDTEFRLYTSGTTEDFRVTNANIFAFDNNLLFNSAGSAIGKVTIDTDATNRIGVVLRGASGQTADLLQVRSTSAASDGDIFAINANGNVGIGTSAPSAKLYISDSVNNTDFIVNSTNNGGNPAAIIHSQYHGLTISTNENSATYKPFVVKNLAGGTPGAGTSIFEVQATGNVGIGTTTLGARLSVFAPSGVTAFSSSVNGNLVTHTVDSWNNWTVAGNAKLKLGSSTLESSGGYLKLQAGGTNQHISMTPSGTGNVGIGTIAPIGLLNVEGAATGKALTILNETGDQDIIAASASGTSIFTVKRNGMVLVGNTSASLATANDIVLANDGALRGLNTFNNNAINIAGLSSANIVEIGLSGVTTHLNGTINSSSGFAVFSGHIRSDATTRLADGTAAAPALSFTSDTNSGLYSLGADSLGLIVGGLATQGITINSSGNVGIGTTSPVQKLNIVGSVDTHIVLQNTSTDKDIGIRFTNANIPSDFWTVGMPENSTYLAFGYGSGFVAGTNEKVVLTTAGNLGIGTTSPDNKLHIFNGNSSGSSNSNSWLTVEDDAHSFIQILGGTTSQTGIVFGDSGSNVAGQLFYDNNGDYMAVHTNSAEKVRIDSNGNVGIGTSAPSAKLQVAGSINLSSNLIFPITSDVTRDIAMSGSGTATIRLQRFSGTDFINFYTNGTRKLYIGANIQTQANIIPDSANTYDLGSSSTTIRSGYFGTSIISPIIYGGTGASSTLTLVGTNNGSPSGAHIILNGGGQGNVGIGSTTPGQALDVVGNARFSAVGSGTYANDLNITADGTLTTASSDVRLKENFVELSDSEILSKVLNLKTYQFNWKNGGTSDLGMIAQEVENIFPELTFTNKVDGYMGINYSRVPTLLISAVQEQQKNILGLSLKLDKFGGVLNTPLATQSAVVLDEIDDSQTQAQEADIATLVESVLARYALVTDKVWEFISEVRFKSKATFEDTAQFLSNVIFKKDVKVDGTLTLNANHAGVVQVPVGYKAMQVTFGKQLSSVPVVTLTPTQKISGQYWVTNVSQTGFVIELSQVQDQVVNINWQVTLVSPDGGVQIEALNFDDSVYSDETQTTTFEDEDQETQISEDLVQESTSSAVLENTDEATSSASGKIDEL